MLDNDAVLTAQQAASLLGAHVETIRRMARRGEIPAYKIGKDWRFRKQALMAWSATVPGHRQRADIMVIDDEHRVRKVIRRHLENAGYRVTTVADPRDGLERVRQNGTDMVLLDLNMSDMNGAMFVKALRECQPQLPVVVVTGRPDSDLLKDALLYGPLMLIPKPIDTGMLLSAISMALKETMTETGDG